MADPNVQLIIDFCKSLDLSQLQRELDQRATQILSRQDDSDRSRRQLVELSKQFTKTSPESARKAVSPLLKSFQSEIDRLSKRSKAAEAAFLYIYKRIIDIKDPIPALEYWLNNSATNPKTYSTNIDNNRLDDDLPVSDAKQVDSSLDSTQDANNKELTTITNSSKRETQDFIEDQRQDNSSDELTTNSESVIGQVLQAKKQEINRRQLLEERNDIIINDKMAETEKENNKESFGNTNEDNNLVNNMKKSESDDNSNHSISIERPSNPSLSTSSSSAMADNRLAIKEKEITQLEEILTQKNKIIKHLEEKLDKQRDYEDVKRELQVLKAELGQIGANAMREQKPFEMYLLEKSKALQSENTAIKAVNDLGQTLPRHLVPPFMPPYQSLGNVETFGSMLGEEIVNSYAKAFKHREVILGQSNDQNSSNNATGSPSPPPTSNDEADAKSNGSAGTPTSTSAIMDRCNDDSAANHTSNSPASLDMSGHNARSSPQGAIGAQYDKLQQQLRVNVEKYMNETLNTLNISRCVRELLSVHNIGQRLFAKYVLGLSQGTVSELLSKPKPWDKLTEKGRDSYRKMHAWAADDRCIYFLKNMVPRKGKETTSFKQEDPAAEERIAQILSEAQRAMVSPNKNGSRSGNTPLLNGDGLQIKNEKYSDSQMDANSDTSDREDKPDARSAASAATLASLYRADNANLARRVLRKFENDDIPQDMVARIYQEELAKLIGQQVEDGFRHPQVYDRSQDEVRQALAIYHQELSRLTQMASGGGAHSPNVSNSELFARFTAASAAAAAGLVNGTNYLSLPQILDPSLPLDARLRSDKQTNGSDTFGASSETDRHSSAFSLVRPKPEISSGHNKIMSSSTPPSGVDRNGSILNNSNSDDLNSAEDLSSAASPLQRMQSITNSLLSQSAIPSVPQTPNRPAKAVLPPITQQQFDQYNNLNTEDIVKKVKEQLSQYSISQRLFGESVLGLSQGSVSDLLARPKPWHMLTQKGREPFIRMKMFLEDENAIHKLVASQYKIAPEKLMRTGSFVAGPTAAMSPVVAPITNSMPTSINTSSSIIKSTGFKAQEMSPVKASDTCRQSISPGFSDTAGHRSSTSTPEHYISSSAQQTAIHSSFSSANSLTSRSRLNQPLSTHGNSNFRNTSSSLAYIQPSVYEMAALTTDLDTQSITTKIKETLMAHNIGQKIFGEVVLGLSQGSVSELLSKPKPWHMLSIKGREPFIRMQLWLNDAHNIDKLQTLKNERREANKRRRTHLDEPIGTVKALGDNIYNFSNNFHSSPNSLVSSKTAILGRPSYGSPVAKKARILFSEEQKEALRVAFSMDPYPSTTTIEFLATELNLSLRTITNWFHNHRMRLKQISSNEDNGSNPTQLPYNIGRDGVNFDPIQFRLLLTQRLSDIRVRNSSGGNPPSPSLRSKYSSIYGTSPVSSHLYANTNSCSSPGSSIQEDDMGTLDLSMTASQQNKDLNRHSMSLNDDSDAGSEGSGDESVELDLSKNSRPVGSSRRKPQHVTSSSSRRKPAQPQWINPGLEFSGDEDDDYVDDGMSDDMVDDDDEDGYNLVQRRDEIINGVCVRQNTDYDLLRNRRKDMAIDNRNAVRLESSIPSFGQKGDQKSNGNDRQSNIKRLEKSLEDDEEGWDDEDMEEDEVRPNKITGAINDDNVLEECVQ
ncbi:homeobox protein cut-like isoform X2 [Oppia nitens]|uniref:homeobox protein cut-like isoform X2 n=1 Tax=Oppia nitens TaxID=1686743 RepID=UPI0023D9E6D8|nr:homeobox protein cut-like isoform X2 [Oppia nitens]